MTKYVYHVNYHYVVKSEPFSKIDTAAGVIAIDYKIVDEKTYQDFREHIMRVNQFPANRTALTILSLNLLHTVH